nr:5-dehydro-4-deoxyglucarate dehydratase [Nakamurella flavida]
MLFFPVTPFRSDGTVDHDLLAEHLQSGLRFDPPAVFAACGTGELASLSMGEHRRVVETAVQSCGTTPVFAGVGGGLGSATAQAVAAQEAGAGGLLILPPYLNEAPQQGWVEYYSRLAECTDLPVVLYQRNQVRFDLDTCRALADVPGVIAFKDGLGDLRQMRELVDELGDRWVFCNGLPTAELTQIDYQALGARSYSSAVFAFFPEMAVAFRDALVAGDAGRAEYLLATFFRPLGQLRDEVPGYAVALVKAALRLGNPGFGPVREPLVGPSPEHLRRLQVLIDIGHEALASSAPVLPASAPA